jgi:DNA-binding Xre family transcriptional regulator
MPLRRSLRNYRQRRKKEQLEHDWILRNELEKVLIMKKNKKVKSEFDKGMENPKFRKLFEKEYGELLLSELILAMMEEDKFSVRKLAKEIGIAPSVLQSIRSGTHSNLTLRNFIKLISALGGEVTIKRGKEYIPVRIAA